MMEIQLGSGRGGAFVDLEKAFDQILLAKLYHYGIRGI